MRLRREIEIPVIEVGTKLLVTKNGRDYETKVTKVTPKTFTIDLHGGIRIQKSNFANKTYDVDVRDFVRENEEVVFINPERKSLGLKVVQVEQPSQELESRIKAKNDKQIIRVTALALSDEDVLKSRENSNLKITKVDGILCANQPEQIKTYYVRPGTIKSKFDKKGKEFNFKNLTDLLWMLKVDIEIRDGIFDTYYKEYDNRNGVTNNV